MKQLTTQLQKRSYQGVGNPSIKCGEIALVIDGN
jgi:hypothetical protein